MLQAMLQIMLQGAGAVGYRNKTFSRCYLQGALLNGSAKKALRVSLTELRTCLFLVSSFLGVLVPGRSSYDQTGLQNVLQIPIIPNQYISVG